MLILGFANRNGQPYEYRGLMAETWDWLRGDPSGRADREFYRNMIAEFGEPVLDAGCGTGRLLLEFAAEGVEIDGVDVSPEMLAICRAKAQRAGVEVALYEQSLESMTLPRRYRTILASSSVLQLVVDQEKVRAAIANLYDHLLPGGALIAPFMTLWRAGMPMQREWENACLRVEDGALLTRMGRVWFDPVTGCEHTEDLYQVLVDGEPVAVEHHRRSPASRSYTQAQAKALLAGAGFERIQFVGGFTNAPASEDDLLFTAIAIKE